MSSAIDIFKSFQSKKETEVLQGTERLSLVATLDSETTYPFYTLTTGAVRVKATWGNRARASIGLNVRLVEVQVKRGTAGAGGTQPGAGLGGVVIIITPSPGTPGSAVTGAAGKFSLPLTVANASASGQLSICGQAPVPLANQSVTGTVLPAGATSAADVTGVGVSVPGYKLRSSTGISVLTVGTFTQFYLGNLCSERGSDATSAPSCRDRAAQATGRRSRLKHNEAGLVGRPPRGSSG